MLSTALGMAFMPNVVKAINPLDALGSVLSSVTSTTNFEIADIAGVWDYQSPAVSFKSDAALSQIGGLAASTALEDKLVSYYNAAGLNTLVLTVNADDSFSMKIRSVSLSGTITKDDETGLLTFNFSAFGKMNIGKVSAMAEKSATNNLTLTFDVSKVISILEKVSDIAKISSIQTLTSLLKNYDGLYAGARLKKTGNAPATTSGSSETTESTNSSNSTSSASGVSTLLNGLFKK